MEKADQVKAKKHFYVYARGANERVSIVQRPQMKQSQKRVWFPTCGPADFRKLHPMRLAVLSGAESYAAELFR